MKERNNRMKYVVKRFAVGLLLCTTIVMAGCSNGENKKVVLTTGFEKNEVFRIEDISCMLPEIMVYLTNTQNQYEQVYGEQIWETGVGDVTLEDNVKDIVLAKMARIKTLNLMAKENDISLNDAEMNKVRVAADEYYESLTKTEREVLGIDRTLITSLYEECALADKVCEHILMDINPEVSDDEARSVTVEHIFMKTYMLDGFGQKVPYTDAMKQKVYDEIKKVLEKANSGEQSFKSLMEEYNEAELNTISFGKGEVVKAFEEAAFNMETGEMSGIIEGEDGYYIIKCHNTFDREETDANKLKIMEKRKEEAFYLEYEGFVASLTRDLNDKLWESVKFIHDDEVTTSSFFKIYDKYFAKEK